MGEYRLSWDQTFLNVAREFSKRATCLRRRFGAVIARDKVFLGEGYNGAASGLEDCLQRGYCIRERLNIPSGTQYETCRSIHAEVNAILDAGKKGGAEGATLYLCGEKGGKGHKLIDGVPCSMCAREIINAKIVRVVAKMANGRIKYYAMDELIEIADHFEQSSGEKQ
ncbi:MAG: cytidine deaminase [Nanoarchaeota archaeon]|nr:cytidine deaminase [Nanoarchaeota archaeon]